MKISFDLHGVVNDLPVKLGMMMETLVKGGAEVHIITGSPTDKAIIELTDLNLTKGVHYTHVIGVGNYLLDIGTEPIEGEYDDYGNPLFREIDWLSAKSKYCKAHQIDLHMDDSDLYDQFFVTPYARLYTKNNHGKG